MVSEASGFCFRVSTFLAECNCLASLKATLYLGEMSLDLRGGNFEIEIG